MNRKGRATASLLLLLAAPSCRGPTTARDTVRIAVPYEVATLDPHAEDKLANLSVVSNLYEPLVAADAEMRIRPALATSWESPDPLTWTFRLRPGVTFHSGRPLRAADVAYSLERVLRSSDLQVRNYLLSVSEVVAVGPLTVRLRTRQPSRILLGKLAQLLVVPEGATSEALRAGADGTGPYSLAAWNPGRSVRLARFDRHWNALPEVREAEIVLGRPPEEALTGLLAGTFQIVESDSRRFEEAARDDRFRVVRRSNLYVKYIACDLARAATPFCDVRPNPFRDARVRRAVSLAVDRRRLVGGLSGHAVPASQPIPRFVFGFNPAIAESPHDPAGARALLEAAGLSGGFRVVLHARRIFGEAPRLVAEDLAAVGVRAEVRVLPDAEFFDLLGRRGSTLWMNRFGCSSGDASDFLEYAVHSLDRDRHFGSINYGGWSDPALDAAIERSAGIEKPEERRDLLQQILAAVMKEQVVIPLYNDQDVYAMERSVAYEPRSDSLIQIAGIRAR